MNCAPAATARPSAKLDRRQLQVLFGPHDAVHHPLDQYRSHLGRAVVVLAGRDVARTAGEVQVAAARLVHLAAFASQAGEITAHPAVAVIAHRMRGIVMTGRDLVRTGIESDGF